ncbi:hypothetical protein TNCV_456451 [Trichonephila clavipes]|uniref:Uncharacterized protein n=1 Tax=Trichonephila clavipes TaxID=2585209 RepID=A0A8X6RLT2_TRICX|nr:hypothetical protein TNCV_456451 [Trichonephila clavipes]
MLNRFYFPPTLPHSTHIRLWCRAGNPTQDLYHQERQLRPSQNMQKKKDVKSILFPTYPPDSYSFVAQTFHMTSITKNDNSGKHKIFNRKKMFNRFYFPPTLPHSTQHSFVLPGGNPTQFLLTKNDNSGRHKIFKRKKMLNRFYFPSTLPHSTHIRLWAGPEIQHRTSITKNDNSGPHKIFNKKKDVKSILFPTYPPAFHPHSFVVPGWKSNTGPLSPRMTTPAVTKYAKKKDVKSILFPIYPPIPPTFFCGAGPYNQHKTSITKNDNSGPLKILNRKRC